MEPKLVNSSKGHLKRKIETFINDDGEVDYSISNRLTMKEVDESPVLLDAEGRFVVPVNNFLTDKLLHGAKNLGPNARGLKLYWTFLTANEISWDDMPADKHDRPTYLFHGLLKKLIREGDIAASTARTYMQAVIGFYRWARRVSYYHFEHQPFEDKWEEFCFKQESGSSGTKRLHKAVLTTDLRISVPKKRSGKVLQPLPGFAEDLLIAALKSESIEMKLRCLLALSVGLRQQEVATFPDSLVRMPAPGENLIRITIGPKQGVATKNDVERDIEVPGSLMAALYDYKVSERRHRRVERYCEQNETKHIPLILTRDGDRYLGNNATSLWSRLRKNIQTASGHPFPYRYHDLRSTYGTKAIKLWIDSGMEPSAALTRLQGLMGHSESKTTWEYIQFLNEGKAESDFAQMQDDFVEKVLNG